MLDIARSSDGRQGSRNRKPARRRRLIALACGLVLLGVACVGGPLATASTHLQSAQSVPDLTGSWRNQADPSSAPPWRLTASNGLQTLDATWMGSTVNGHPDLRGSFHTTLMQSGATSFYRGPYQVTEDAPPVGGTITVTIDSGNQIEFTLQPASGGASQHYIFIRVSFTPPSAIDVAPIPALFGAVVFVNEPAPGDEGAGMSPPLGTATSADATVTGVSPDDVTFYSAAVIVLARQYCFVQAIKRVTAAFKANPLGIVSSVDAEAGPVYDLLKLTSTAVLLNAASCMADASTMSAVLDQLNSGTSTAAHAAAAACGVTPFTITLRSSGGKPRPKKIQIAKRKGLSVRCTRSGGTVKFHVASTSGPLRKLVGPRLIVGIARSRRDSAGGKLSFSFQKH
jgi:hypothetical protein